MPCNQFDFPRVARSAHRSWNPARRVRRSVSARVSARFFNPDENQAAVFLWGGLLSFISARGRHRLSLTPYIDSSNDERVSRAPCLTSRFVHFSVVPRTNGVATRNPGCAVRPNPKRQFCSRAAYQFSTLFHFTGALMRDGRRNISSPHDLPTKPVDGLEVLAQPRVLEKVVDDDPSRPPPPLPPGVGARDPHLETLDHVRLSSPAAAAANLPVGFALPAANEALHALYARLVNVPRFSLRERAVRSWSKSFAVDSKGGCEHASGTLPRLEMKDKTTITRSRGGHGYRIH